MQQAFTSIYECRVWGNNGNPQYNGSSGPGSAIAYNQPYINFIRGFILTHNVKSVADVGCGDFRCGELIYADKLGGIQYHGYDVYEKLINHLKETHPQFDFVCLDASVTPELIQPADLCIIKDVMQHWPNVAIDRFLDYVVTHKLFKYILITNDTAGEDGMDTVLGGYHRVTHRHPTLQRYGAKVVFTYYQRICCLINQ